MKYQIEKNTIRIKDKSQFNPQHILECGQIFAFSKKEDYWEVFSKEEQAKIFENQTEYIIESSNVNYFCRFFDLETDYEKIKNQLKKNSIMKKAIEFGYGIRILKNDVFETVISFIISANNNIKRIQNTLFKMREMLGEKKGEYHAFPTFEKLKKQNADFFKSIGCGYRAEYLVKVLTQTNPDQLEKWKDLPTEILKQNLLQLAGVGPKVADCILLFGYSKQDVFPVDTWIEKVHNEYFGEECNRLKIRKNLVERFGDLSGYAQQYLFYFQRSS